MAQNFEDLLCLPSLRGVDSYIYQQETVRKVLRHFKGRAVLADEVGLGKTIEACLELKEYWMRGLVRKALVLTPPSLVSQWKGELIEKFGLAPVSPDGAEFRRDPARFWKSEPLVVSSIAQARLDLHAAAIAAVPWDMVIVDEAHCLKNRSSANWQLVDSLQKKFILMLTATQLTQEEKALREILAALIEVYDEEHYRIPEQPPHKMVKLLMEQRGLKQADLVSVLGSRAQVSDLVNGKRSISKAQAKKLAEYLGVSAELFI
jgi:antitoxin component HigA of HigAB toxin-antitoxin module